ncbi:unnamed protein product [Microthlaspi erraticum]|uniref:Uncharacterized protein n=1 Tax=Microthlaspi erraticum TaxID=1685480 RepID=A0A6D2J4G1_9BRAS|nr:unnamed protein product [Microthlaspi erraticum]
MAKRGAKNLTRAQGGPNLKSVLRHDHLKNLALWSVAGDTPLPPVATLLGRLLAAEGEASGIAPDPDLVSCQRCETILQPGFNCKVRIDKVSAKKKKKKKPNIVVLPQNNVVYYCSFCSHRNLKRGTSRGQMKEICPPKPKAPKKMKKAMTMMRQETQSNMLSSPERSGKDQVETSVVDTPKPMLTLERDKRIRRSKSKKPMEPESVPEKKATVVGGSDNRKRKSWTSMKEIAETNKSFKIPFRL